MATPINFLLSSLSSQASALLLSQSTAVPLPLRTQLYEPDVVPEHAFFVTSGLASVVAPMIDGDTAELEVIGNEGVVGSLHLLGTAPIPTSSFMQIAGSGLRVKLSVLQHAFNTSREIHHRILELVQQQALTVSQVAACNRLHSNEARLARWLLMAQDRTQSKELALTQQFLAQMVGSQRTTVTATAGNLQRASLIQYRQGRVTIVDREGLVKATCDCYRIVKRLYTGLYGAIWIDPER